ncbi:MAG: hypothetical protein DRP29_03150 [Thermodesulfobacteriota bacterium]|nr:MAG: hypothetical protein DRP29_03150 [Thermodesulfobacteriota bacterium]
MIFSDKIFKIIHKDLLMKINFTKVTLKGNFNLNISSLKRVNSPFEEYLKTALIELKTQELLKKSQEENIHILFQKVEESLGLLEKITQMPLDNSSSETTGDYLLAQALEIDKIAETFSESSLKSLFKELAFFIGTEAQKIKQGHYSI